MKNLIFLTFLIVVSGTTHAQSFKNVRDVNPPKEYENIWSQKLYSDSLSSAFVIYIKNGVKLHKHESHTEQVYVISGTGDMQLGEDRLSIVTGDIISIPMGTPHSLKVTSPEPVSIISVQSPEFTGKDRVFIE